MGWQRILAPLRGAGNWVGTWSRAALLSFALLFRPLRPKRGTMAPFTRAAGGAAAFGGLAEVVGNFPGGAHRGCRGGRLNLAGVGWRGVAEKFEVRSGVGRKREEGEFLVLGSEVLGDRGAGVAFVLGGGEGEDFGGAGEEFAGSIHFVTHAVHVGSFGEEGAAGDKATHAAAVFVVEERDEFRRGGVDEAVEFETGELGAVLFEEAEEVVGLLGLLDAEGAEGEFDDAFDFAEEVVLAEHFLGSGGKSGRGEECLILSRGCRMSMGGVRGLRDRVGDGWASGRTKDPRSQGGDRDRSFAKLYGGQVGHLRWGL